MGRREGGALYPMSRQRRSLLWISMVSLMFSGKSKEEHRRQQPLL